MKDTLLFIIGEILHIGNQYGSFSYSSSLTRKRGEDIIHLSKHVLGKRKRYSKMFT